MSISRIGLWAWIALSLANPVHAQFTTYWRLSENQLDIREGGRVSSIAVSPFDPHVMFAASESGGLFKTTSAGAHWAHVEKLPVIFTQSVVFPPSPHSTVVLVSAKADFKTHNGGGVWRSADGGATWTQTLKNRPTEDRLSAYEMSVRPSTGMVFVGTSNGAFMSSDGGEHWDPFPVFSGEDKNVFSVMATDSRIFFGGPSGVRTASANLILQAQSNGNPIREMHAFAQRGSTQQVFFVDDARRLFVSFTGGDVWSRIVNEPEGTGRCAGLPFIKAVDYGANAPVDLYYSNRCTLHKLVAPNQQQDIPNFFLDDWEDVDIDRGRPRDLAFVGTTPLLLASTAGVHRQAALNDWQLIGGGRDGGLNALQINEVKGQFTGQETDLYVGTHENGLFAATVDGDVVGSTGNDGHSIELERWTAGTVPTITFETGNRNQRSNRRLLNIESWPNPPSHRRAPVLLESCRYVQQIATSLIFRSPGMAITENCGESWDRFAFYREQTLDLPKVGLDISTTTILYQPYKSAELGTSRLMRIAKSPDLVADVQFPAMSAPNNAPDVGLGINATGFGGYQVYAVNPFAVQHIIAPDVVNGEMMETTTGGQSWQPMSQLTNLVTRVDATGSPQYLFNTDLAGPAAGKVFPIVTSISRNPRAPFGNLMLVGTVEGGIYASNDGGTTWQHVVDSEKATYVTGFFWESANSVHVSTYGRGLWRLRVRNVVPAEDFDDFCSSCDVVSMDPGSTRPPFDRSALIFNGQVRGVRTDNRKLREVFVTPGSSVLFTGDPQDPQDDIAITESDGRDPSQFEPLPQPKDGWIAAGVVFTKDDELVGAVFAESELAGVPPKSEDPDLKISTESPTKGKPYITLTTSGAGAVPTVEAEEVFDLSATDFAAGGSYEVVIDGTPIKGEITADGNGCFERRITAPSDAGYHSISVRMTGDETMLDRSLFFVRTGY